MQFLIADTFSESLGRLTGDEQRAAKMAAFDLQLNPATPGLRFHKLDKSKDKRFWSVSPNMDLRIIVHRTDASLLLCYVDHHDKAYAWAERRKLETHPTTGAAQIVEIRETVKEVVVPVYVEHQVSVAPKKDARRVFDGRTDEELLACGVPQEWLADVRVATGESLLALTDHLPAEASEALLELATGGSRPSAMRTASVGTHQDVSPFEHPDAQRRFRLMTNADELARALDYPWDKWTIFLHPDQRQTVERDYAGPARVAGSAGTGKTIVALHRAAHLARSNSDARVLLTTYSDTLANALRSKLRKLLGNEPKLGERIDVHSLTALGLRLHKSLVGAITLAERAEVRDLVASAAKGVTSHKFTLPFLMSEWDQVVDAWQLDSWESYRDVARLGRKTRLPEAQRNLLWSIFSTVREGLNAKNRATEAAMFGAVTAAVSNSKHPPFDFAVVDEAQDLGIPHVRFLAALGRGRPNALFFAGDLGQRIFQQPFSWKALGVDVRGRSRTLRVNYRTSHQIRSQADRLLGPSFADVDGNDEKRAETVSVFNGPSPSILTLKTEADERSAVVSWLAERIRGGTLPHEIGVFVRSDEQVERATAAINAAGLPFKVLDMHVETVSGHVSVCTMHLAKGLEFRAVVVMACDDEIMPLQARIEAVGDNADLQEVYDTERQLLYVACTRAREQLLVTSVEPRSEFLDDFSGFSGHS
jgi:hypothetical protein